ncbi:MAG: hypothetical protein Q9164_004991 [Protoblastenia rupestris]
MAIEVAEAVGSYSDYPADGILGLGWGKINRVRPKPQQTFMEKVQPSLPNPVFAVDLTDSKPEGSTIEFGAMDYSRGPFSKAKVDNLTGYWRVNDISFEVQGAILPQNQSMHFGAFLPSL